MNKYLLSLVLFSQTILFGQSNTPNNPFVKLTPTIYNQAQTWAAKVANSLDDDMQITFLNLLALNATASFENNEEEQKRIIQAFIKCMEHIEAQQDMLSLYEELGMSTIEILKTYVENIQEKISKKNVSNKDKQALNDKLQTKMQELLAYTNAIYYHALYTQVAKKNTALVYMFDENGIIAAEKRTHALPRLG